MALRQPVNGPHRGWIIGLAAGVVAFSVLCGVGLATQSFGVAFVIGAPFIAGYVIGRWAGVGRVLRFVAALAALGGVILGAVTASLAGAVCGTVFGIIASIPLLIGVAVGGRLSRPIRPTGTIASVVFVALLIPVEHSARPPARIESVSTSRVFDMAPRDAFRRITFYEDTRGTPPRLLRIALPRPIATLGAADHVGDRPRCLYDDGYLVKEITAIQPPSLYEFKVIQQVGVESHAVVLVGGSFRLRRLGPVRTRVVLTTRYRSKLTARFAWRPFEQAVIRALHEHVLDNMAGGVRR